MIRLFIVTLLLILASACSNDKSNRNPGRSILEGENKLESPELPNDSQTDKDRDGVNDFDDAAPEDASKQYFDISGRVTGLNGTISVNLEPDNNADDRLEIGSTVTPASQELNEGDSFLFKLNRNGAFKLSVSGFTSTQFCYIVSDKHIADKDINNLDIQCTAREDLSSVINSVSDRNFRDCLNSIQTDLGLSYADEVVSINCSQASYRPNSTINTIDNIDKLVNLESLYVFEHTLTSVNVSNNIKLRELDLSTNDLNSIDVSNNTELTALILYNNDLDSISTDNNLKLKDIVLKNNNLRSVDFSNNTRIIDINVDCNKLTSLTINNNPNLDTLSADSTTRDEDCNDDYPESRANDLRVIDVSSNLKLRVLRLNFNALDSIDLTNNPLLERVYIESNALNAIDFNQNTKLSRVYLGGNQLVSIDLSNNPELYLLHLDQNDIDIIDITNNIYLYEFNMNNNNLIAIPTGMELTNNSFATINLRNNNFSAAIKNELGEDSDNSNYLSTWKRFENLSY